MDPLGSFEPLDTIDVVTRPEPLQRRILGALAADTTGWDHAQLR